MAKPGVVLKRPVGTDGSFGEHAELPKNLGQDRRKKPAHKPSAKAKKSLAQPHKAADRKAAQDYEREHQRREREEAKEEAARQKRRARRQEAIDKAQTALDTAEEKHMQRVVGLRAQIEAIEKKLQAEDANWDEDVKRLKAALRGGREGGNPQDQKTRDGCGAVKSPADKTAITPGNWGRLTEGNRW